MRLLQQLGPAREVSCSPTAAVEAKPCRAVLGERPAPSAAGSKVPAPLRLLHILFVQKPERERKEEALMTQRLGSVLPGLGGQRRPGRDRVIGARQMSQVLTLCLLSLGPWSIKTSDWN